MGQAGQPMQQAVINPSVFSGHTCVQITSPTCFIDQIRREKARLSFDLDCFFPLAPADCLEIDVATLEEVSEACNCKNVNISTSCSVALTSSASFSSSATGILSSRNAYVCSLYMWHIFAGSIRIPRCSTSQHQLPRFSQCLRVRTG